jgi:hypothetical protein
MKENQFQLQNPNIVENQKLRKPQREGFLAIQKHFSETDAETDAEREVGLILPVGCGKSGLIAITPFALKAKRALTKQAVLAGQARCEVLGCAAESTSTGQPRTFPWQSNADLSRRHLHWTQAQQLIVVLIGHF